MDRVGRSGVFYVSARRKEVIDQPQAAIAVVRPIERYLRLCPDVTGAAAVVAAHEIYDRTVDAIAQALAPIERERARELRARIELQSEVRPQIDEIRRPEQGDVSEVLRGRKHRVEGLQAPIARVAVAADNVRP